MDSSDLDKWIKRMDEQQRAELAEWDRVFAPQLAMIEAMLQRLPLPELPLQDC